MPAYSLDLIYKKGYYIIGYFKSQKQTTEKPTANRGKATRGGKK